MITGGILVGTMHVLFLINAHYGYAVIILPQAVKMTSVKTQLPYEYYTLPFCEPADGNVIYRSLNLGKR